MQISRHVYRGLPWFVVQDLQAGKFHRLSPQSYAVFARMDGRKTVQELWELACKLFPESPPSQTELLQLLSQFHNADLITGDRRPNLAEIDRRAREETRKTAIGYVKNPLSVRLPLFDPEPVLRSLTPVARSLFSPLGAVIWCILILTAILAAFMSWERLEVPGADAVLSASSIAYLAVSYIFIKLLHELGHGLAIKRWGGEVREVGIMMLIFFPVPYVDASQASYFSEKYQRILVSAAGILVELAIAAVAFIVWTVAEEGTVSAIAYNLFLIGGISTLIFNGNPLLRFDGYFVFADLIEIPNLGQRSNQYFWFLFQKNILGHSDARPPVVSHGEEGWLLGYAICAFVYRMFVMLLISLYVASVLPVVGVAIVLWSLYTVFVVPAWKGVRFLMTEPSLEVQRGRAILRVTLLGAMIIFFFFWVPLPHTTVADAVLEPKIGSVVRSQGHGFVSKILVKNGDLVEREDALIKLSEPLLDVERSIAQAELEDAKLRLEMIPLDDANARSLWVEQLNFYQARIDELRLRSDDLVVRAPSNGLLVLPNQRDMLGRLLRQGEVIGAVQSQGELFWKTAVPASRAELVDSSLLSVTLKPRTLTEIELDAFVIDRSPEITTRLESFALTNRAGGRLVADPMQEEPYSITPVASYLLSSGLPERSEPPLPVGARATVRFVHPPSPLAPRIWRAVRQTFLAYFGI